MGNSISLKSEKEIRLLFEANQIVAATLKMLQELIEPGISTMDLDQEAERFCRQSGARPAFKGYRGFPGSLCVSLNEQVVHGIPSKKVILKEGDLVSIDFGVEYKGYYGDSAVTIPVGAITADKDRLVRVTEESLKLGIAEALVGQRISDISAAVQGHAEKNGFSVVRQFVGHGIGKNLHEAPEVPNYKRSGRSPRLVAGMVLAIEPMINIGGEGVRVLKDGWTVITTDRKASAHFEHSIVIKEDGPQVLSQMVQ